MLLIKCRHIGRQRLSFSGTKRERGTISFDLVEGQLPVPDLPPRSLTFQDHQLVRIRRRHWCEIDTGEFTTACHNAIFSHVISQKFKAKNGSDVEINWSDDHKSVYSYEWLENRSFRNEKQNNYIRNDYIPQKKLWKKEEFNKIMKTYEYKNVVSE